MLVTIQNVMLLFSPCKRCPCPCSDAVLRSCEEALAGIILHRPPSLWFAWVRSGCAGMLGGPGARGAGGGDTMGGGVPYLSYIYIYIMYVCMHACMYVCTYVRMHICAYVCMYVCMCVCTYLCMHACMHACMHMCVYVYIHIN